MKIGKYAIIITLFLLSGCGSTEVIGKVYGPEHEYIVIGDDTYTVCSDSEYSAKDRDAKLGKVEFENADIDAMVVYSIKGVEDREYIYTLWLYDGAIYKKNVE